MTDLLDRPVLAALRGRHKHLALNHGRAARYDPAVSVFGAIEDATALRDLEELVRPGEPVCLLDFDEKSLSGTLQPVMEFSVRQFVCEESVAGPENVPRQLHEADNAAALQLAELTRPGPFSERTTDMGYYCGFDNDEGLVAFGGERLQPPGFTEVSAICTHPSARGKGYAEAIVRALCTRIQSSGETPFLHVAVDSPSEATASRLYERVGFRERRTLRLTVLERPT